MIGTVWLRFSIAGRPGGGGGGGRLRTGPGPGLELGAVVKFFCLLRAAMRSASVLN